MIVVIITFITTIIVIFFKETKKYSIEELFNFSINDVCEVLINGTQGSEEDISYYFNGYFKKYSGSLGNTAHRTVCLYDKNNKLLLEIEDIGNNGIVRLTGDNINGYYQFIKTKIL